MFHIEIDGDVYGFLQENAEPFIDTPNDVLRRLLLGEAAGPGKNRSEAGTPAGRSSATGAFVRQVIEDLEGETAGSFQVRSPYRYMYDSEDRTLYFQNFSRAGAENLWYRVSENALRDLDQAGRQALVCLAAPIGGAGGSGKRLPGVAPGCSLHWKM